MASVLHPILAHQDAQPVRQKLESSTDTTAAHTLRAMHPSLLFIQNADLV